MTPAPRTEILRRQSYSDRLRELGWYHSYRFPDGSSVEGVKSLAFLEESFSRFPLPLSLVGRTVLDIGAWDGWFSFEAERRGAAVTAVDCVETAHFRSVKEKLGSRVDYRVGDVFELPRSGLAPFDFVFFLGVLYHVKHPLLALEIVCSLTKDIAVVDSFVKDAASWRAGVREEVPTLEFYETDELGGLLDNWFAPSVACLLGLCRAAGFARVELLHVSETNATVACYRRWEPPKAMTAPAPVLSAVVDNLTGGINVSARSDTYLAWWFRCDGSLSRHDLQCEVDGLGCHAVSLTGRGDGYWSANTILPPGLSPGWKPARLRTTTSGFSETRSLAVDVPLRTGSIELVAVKDGLNWQPNRLTRVDGAYLALWVKGLPSNADIANVSASLSGADLRTEYVGEPDAGDSRQVNVRPDVAILAGAYELVVAAGESRSTPMPLEVL